MSGAALDRLLAVLLAAQVATGLLTLRAGIPSTAPLFWLHGLLGGALLVAATVKLRRSIGPAIRHRRWGRLAIGSLLSLLVAAALVGGFAWVASGRILSIGPWTILTLHVWAGLAASAVVVFHLLPHRWRLLRARRAGTRGRATSARPMTRRTAIGLLATAAVGAVAWWAAETVDRLLGGTRRFTGSRWLPDGGAPPATTFFGEPAPAIAAPWRLAVAGTEREAAWDLDALRALGESDREAVLDCTSGWAHRTTWRGVPLPSLVRAAGGDPARDDVVVRSVTGWSTRLPPDEVAGALLATAVDGEPLATANGAPVRLVVPTRRGLDWVKWVGRIEIG
jgi:DMSO/TMAO reductase YedYZ molybdopterin-dependent catalytic subunit